MKSKSIKKIIDFYTKNPQKWADLLAGGKADKKTPRDFNKDTLIEGARVESEHTNNPRIGIEVASDHISELPNYYNKLKEMEKAESPLKRTWKVKISGSPDWHWCTGVEDYNDGTGNHYVLEDGRKINQRHVIDLDMNPKPDVLEKGVNGNWQEEGYKFRATKRKGTGLIIRAYKGTKNVGHMAMNDRSSTDGYHSVYGSYVDEAHRGKSLYQEMIRHGIKLAQSLGSKGVKSEGFQRSPDATRSWQRINPEAKQDSDGTINFYADERHLNKTEPLKKADSPEIPKVPGASGDIVDSIVKKIQAKKAAKTTPGKKIDTITAKETPRTEAKANLNEDVKSGEYVNARKSKFKNTGEDITNSARHKAMEWKGLAQAEVEGNADKLVNLKTLLKHDPPQFELNPDGSNQGAVLAAHYAMQKLPKQPELPADYMKKFKDEDVAWHEYTVPADQHLPERTIIEHHATKIPERLNAKLTKQWTVGDIKAKGREMYVDLYNHMKKEAESVARQPMSAQNAINTLKLAAHNWYGSKTQKRNQGEKTLNGQFLNQFIDYIHNKAFSNHKANSIKDAVSKFNNGLEQSINNNPELRDAHAQYMTDNVFHVANGTEASGPEYVKKHKKVLDHIHGSIHNILKGKALTDTFELEKKKTRRFDPANFYATELRRKGPDHGFTDSESHSNYLTTHSKMRGLQYGNSVTDPEREHHLAQSAIAMKDLTSTLNLPAEMGSFNGRLGLAFGARGKGTAAAHYEPSLNVINLTRHNGIGTLAHEWSHAFDDILGRVTDQKDSYASDSSRRMGESHKHPSQDHEKVYKPMRNLTNLLQGEIRHRISNDWREHGRDEIGAAPMNDYWMTTKELFARGFEKYLQNKMKKNGHENTYLTGMGGNHWLWPTDDEVEKLTPHFDELFENFRRSDFLKKSLSLGKDKLQKTYEYKGTIRPEESDPNGTVHPEKPHQIKGVSKNGPAWFIRPDIAKKNEQSFNRNYGNFVKGLSESGKKHMLNLGKLVATDSDRHVVATATSDGGQALRLRHLNYAMTGNPGYSIVEKDNGLRITIPRHSGRTDKSSETHTWHFDEKGLKFLSKNPINKSLGGDYGRAGNNMGMGGATKVTRPNMGGSDGGGEGGNHGKEQKHERADLGRFNGTPKGNGFDVSESGRGHEGSGRVLLKKSEPNGGIQIASVAVISGNKLLMGKRNSNQKYTMPGGHLNPGEEPMDGAKRELLEEAGITPDEMYYLGSKNVVGLDGKNRMIHSFVCFGDYKTDAKKDPDEEVDTWEWVDCKENLPEDVQKMLHSPKNITLQFLGLQNA